MKLYSRTRGLQVWAGLVAAPLAWAIAVQLSQILPYVDCAQQTHSTAVATIAATAIALVAAVLSWWRGGAVLSSDGQPRRFGGSVAGLTALVLSYALSLQLLASLVLNACDR
jgi:hypothetical protein